VKVAMIGAGSVVFAQRLMTDILSWPELRETTIAMMDINADRLEMIGALADRLVREQRLPARVETTTERRAALDGADYVITMIQVGGAEAVAPDLAIPQRYGVDQAVGDTLGPGGIFRGLRTIPPLLDICRDMEDLCPDALLINYANPMVMNCRAIAAATTIRTIGLCHSVQGTSQQLAGYIGAPYEEITHWVAGINHQAWFLRFERNGEDAYPALRAAMDDPAIHAKDAVRFELMRHFGAFVTESSPHLSEYVPYFRRTREIAERHGLSWAHTLDRYIARQEEYYERVRRQAIGAEPIPTGRTHEYCSSIIHAIETGTPFRMNANVPNTGLITNLPAGCCVEVPCLVDDAGVHPCHVGALPPQLAGLNRTNISVQELAVKAALEGDREAVYHAVALDPLTAAVLTLDEARRMTDELFAASAPWLPRALV
jgi:alpha-galactosidase